MGIAGTCSWSKRTGAYALGDEERLRWVLEAWERSPEAVPGSDPEATRQRLLRRIAQVQEQLDLSASELASMTASPLWQLKVMVDEGTRRGQGFDERHDRAAEARHHGRSQPPGRHSLGAVTALPRAVESEMEPDRSDPPRVRTE